MSQPAEKHPWRDRSKQGQQKGLTSREEDKLPTSKPRVKLPLRTFSQRGRKARCSW